MVTYPGFFLALLGAAVLPNGQLLSATLAVLVSAGFFFPIWLLTQGGIGLADVKLALFIGAALGLPGAFTALALGVAAGGTVMLALLLAGLVTRRQVTPCARFSPRAQSASRSSTAPLSPRYRQRSTNRIAPRAEAVPLPIGVRALICAEAEVSARGRR